MKQYTEYGLHHVKMCLQAYAQSDQSLHCQPTELLDITECIDGEQMPVWDLVHAQDDVNLHILRMLKETFFCLGQPVS